MRFRSDYRKYILIKDFAFEVFSGKKVYFNLMNLIKFRYFPFPWILEKFDKI